MERAEIIRRQQIRGMLLDLLGMARQGGVSFGLTYEQLCKGFRRSTRADVSAAELRTALEELTEHRLIGRTWDEQLDSNFYAITVRGSDFAAADKPWDRIDEFTGRAGL